MRVSLFLVILLVMSPMSIHARMSLAGIVVDADSGDPIAGASVRLVDASGKIKRFAGSRSDGTFSLAIPEGSDSMKVQVAGMGYSTAEFSVSSLTHVDTLRVELYT
ncbi:MAG: carboxypeptidase-like regulatory domain-containing protein, partial [Muribaculaceae bacterium]|nr:carboxypeptidase-like regulatory domain-containing protein [Muribaculaceae bacterium]